MTAGAWDRPQEWAPPVVLSVGFPEEEDDVSLVRLLEIEEALLSFGRAALAQGRRLLVPGDPVVAPLIAQTAAEYAPPSRTESPEATAPLVNVLTEGPDALLEETLAGVGHVRTMTFGEREVAPMGRHRLTYEAVGELEPAAAVVIGGSRESVDDILVLREYNVSLFVVGATLAGPLRELSELREYDVTERFLTEIDWRGRPDGEGGVDFEGRIPYPYLMQRLVEELGERAGR